MLLCSQISGRDSPWCLVWCLLLTLCSLLPADWLWRCDRRTGWHPQLWWGLESQLYHLHCDKILVLSLAVRNLWHSHGSHLGHFFCHFIIPPHLVGGALYSELLDRNPVYRASVFHLHPHLLRSTLRRYRQNVQFDQSINTEGSVSDVSRSPMRGSFPLLTFCVCVSQSCQRRSK